MASMLVRNKVRDFDVWKEVFFLLSISDMDRARVFTADPASAATGVRAGVLGGEIHYIEDVA